jgi:hypothetical protein
VSKIVFLRKHDLGNSLFVLDFAGGGQGAAGLWETEDSGIAD